MATNDETGHPLQPRGAFQLLQERQNIALLLFTLVPFESLNWCLCNALMVPFDSTSTLSNPDGPRAAAAACDANRVETPQLVPC